MCLQDSTGYMWFATQNGAAKFDGHTFQNFTTGSGLNSNNITSLYYQMMRKFSQVHMKTG
ncbi:MAG: hypothetical protein IPL53_00250 [Ignavibacteria bacterium]|nr:hypothetical protein [Ignavibacteria bacterium]